MRGTGFDFDEHRPYRPGDDVRRIDWNVTARLNTPFLRQTHAERELTVIVALDLSPSMMLGSSRYSKKEVMMFIAASLLFSATSDQINVGFLAFSDRVLQWLPPRRAFWCDYLVVYLRVAVAYDLPITRADADRVREIQPTC